MGIPAFFDSFKALPAGDGAVYLAPQLQGRIFASLDGEVLHRFDAALGVFGTEVERTQQCGGAVGAAREADEERSPPEWRKKF